VPRDLRPTSFNELGEVRARGANVTFERQAIAQGERRSYHYR